MDGEERSENIARKWTSRSKNRGLQVEMLNSNKPNRK